MSVTQTFQYTATPPANFIQEDEWAKTLSVEDQAAFQNAFLAQRALVQAQIAAGNLVESMTNGIVWTWKDQASADAFVWDTNYKTFFDKYLVATNMKFEIITKTV